MVKWKKSIEESLLWRSSFRSYKKVQSSRGRWRLDQNGRTLFICQWQMELPVSTVFFYDSWSLFYCLFYVKGLKLPEFPLMSSKVFFFPSSLSPPLSLHGLFLILFYKRFYAFGVRNGGGVVNSWWQDQILPEIVSIYISVIVMSYQRYFLIRAQWYLRVPLRWLELRKWSKIKRNIDNHMYLVEGVVGF